VIAFDYYILSLLLVCLLLGGIAIALAWLGTRWMPRRWPREQHPSYFSDCKRLRLPEDE
jgi:hypothetical protein